MIRKLTTENTVELKYDDNTTINVKVNPSFEDKYIFTIRSAEYSIDRSSEYNKDTAFTLHAIKTGKQYFM